MPILSISYPFYTYKKGLYLWGFEHIPTSVGFALLSQQQSFTPVVLPMASGTGVSQKALQASKERDRALRHIYYCC